MNNAIYVAHYPLEHWNELKNARGGPVRTSNEPDAADCGEILSVERTEVDVIVTMSIDTSVPGVEDGAALMGWVKHVIPEQIEMDVVKDV